MAGEALRLGYELQCPIPFNRLEYVKDFAPGPSRTEYGDLLALGKVYELDGRRSRAGEAYLAAGLMVLNQCDLLIAVWDGDRSRGTGGTGEIVQSARNQMIPVVWIDPKQPRAIFLIRPGYNEDKKWQCGLKELLEHLFIPQGSEYIHMYFREKQPRINCGILYRLFINTLGRVKRVESSRSNSSIPSIEQDLIEQHYAWTDSLANYYASLYRSSFLANYFLSAMAVFFALTAFAAGWTEKYSPMYQYQWVPIVIELLIITWIVITIILGKRLRWHERWIDYRLLAELLRNMCILIPLGLSVTRFRMPAHYTHDNVVGSWINWHFQGVVRQAGLTGATVDTEYLNTCRGLLDNHIAEQMDFHQMNEQRCHKISHRLHTAGLCLFGLTFMACGLHLFWHTFGSWLTMLCAFLPAMGAAVAGILFQGEFKRLEKRSGAMYDALSEIRKRLGGLRKDENYHQNLSQLAGDTAEVMVREVLDWRILFRDRPLQLPS